MRDCHAVPEVVRCSRTASCGVFGHGARHPPGAALSDRRLEAAGERELTVRWLDIMASKWLEPTVMMPEKGQIRLLTPDDGYWAVRIHCCQAH